MFFSQKPIDFFAVLCYTNMRVQIGHAYPLQPVCKGIYREVSSGERADRRRWRMKGGERVAAVKIWRSEQRATNFGHRNRVEEAPPITKLSCKSFSDNLIFFMEKYSSGRRGVTRKQTALVTVYFPKPLHRLAFTDFDPRQRK